MGKLWATLLWREEVGRAVRGGEWCFPDPAYLEDAASTPTLEVEGRSTTLCSCSRWTGQVRIVGTVSLWAKALSFTGVQALKVAALCRGQYYPPHWGHTRNMVSLPPKAEASPWASPSHPRAYFSVALAVSCPVSKSGLFPVSLGKLLFRAFRFS